MGFGLLVRSRTAQSGKPRVVAWEAKRRELSESERRRESGSNRRFDDSWVDGGANTTRTTRLQRERDGGGFEQFYS